MAQNAFVQSMKTIAESLIRKAGFDKTRSGKVVGVNSLTNTYSVKVDGHVYNNVRVVNDSTYNVGDTVRVNMPVNQPSQLYISASIYSDASIGKKIGHAESLIDAADREITDIREIMGKIYQLSIRSEYSATGVTHYGVLMQNGEDVTSPEYTVDFHWYLQKVEGKTAIGVGETVTLLKEDFLYGQAVLLEWVVDDNVMLRAQVILFDNTKVEDLAEVAHDAYDIATNEAQYFWFNEDETDNGAHISYYRKDDFESNPRGHNLLANADGVAIRQGVGTLSAFSADGMYVNGMLNNQLQSLANFTKDGIWFNEGIGYTIGNDSAYVKYVYDNGWKIKISADQITLGNQQVATTDMIVTDVPYLTEISSGGLFVHRNDSGYAGSDPSSSTAYGVKLASTVDIIRAGKSLATFDESQITFRTKDGYTTATVGTSGFTLYRGVADANNYAVASFTGNGMTLKNTSGVNTLVSNSSGLTIYNGGTSTNVALASFSASGITLKNSSNLTTFTAGANSMTMYSGSGSNPALASFGSGGMTLQNTSGYPTCAVSASSFTLYDGTSSRRQIALFNASGMTLKNSSNYTLCTVGGTGMTLNNSSGNTLATFSANGMSLMNGSGVTLCNVNTSGMTLTNSSSQNVASFTGSEARLGRNSSTATIYMCNDIFNIRGLSTYGSLSCPTLEICPVSSSGNRFVAIGSHRNTVATTGGAYVGAGYISSEGGYGAAMRGGASNIYCTNGVGIGISTANVQTSDTFFLEWGTTSMMRYVFASDTPQKRIQFPHSCYNIGGNTARLTSNGTLNWNSSTHKIKTDIVYDSDKFDPAVDPHQLYKLRVVQFKYKDEHLEQGDFNKGRNVLGLIAEDVDRDYQIAAYHDNNGEVVNWDYAILVPALIKMVQEQHEDIEILKEKLDNLERSAI